MIDNVANGRPPFEEWSSEHYDVAFTTQGITFSSLLVAGEAGQYSADEVREAVEAYWRFLASQPESPNLIREYRPDLPYQRLADLARWKEKWEPMPPYRGRLF